MIRLYPISGLMLRAVTEAADSTLTKAVTLWQPLHVRTSRPPPRGFLNSEIQFKKRKALSAVILQCEIFFGPPSYGKKIGVDSRTIERASGFLCCQGPGFSIEDPDLQCVL